MSDDRVPLPGDFDFVPLSEEDTAKLIAAHQSDETSPEVRAQLDVYVALPYSNHLLELTVFDRLFKHGEELMVNENALAGPADTYEHGSVNLISLPPGSSNSRPMTDQTTTNYQWRHKGTCTRN